jgi:formate hydrogenlyase subunit 3/multisubunit Na+/H+ antiporter MnhD subunit
VSGEMSAASFVETAVLILVPVLPLLTAAALLPQSWRRRVVRLAPWASLPALIAAAVSSGALLDLPWLLLGGRLGVDDVGRVFLFFTAVLWLLAGIYGRSYLAGDPRRARFFVFYLLTMSGNLGLIVAQDVLSFYLFFSLMSFSSYGLIVHNSDPEALRAGRVYIYLVVLGEVLLLAGLVVGTWHAGTLNLDQFAGSAHSNLVIGLLLAGFGIKVGALPLHVWLPLAHPVAPTPASAVLSGAMIKAGLLGWLRFLPLGQVALPEWSLLCIAAGLGAAIYGVLIGLFQDEPKTVLAYSSISQMGLMTVGVGLGMAAPEIWPLCLSAVLIYALHHALAKGALFLGVGVAAATGSGVIQRCLVVAGLLLPALALAGLPFTSGAVAKIGLKSLVYVLPAPWPEWMAVLLLLIAVGTTLLMARFLYLVWPQGSGQPRLTAGLWLPWTVLLIVVAFSIWLWPAADAATLQTLSVSGFWHALWPASVAAISAWAAWTLARKVNIKLTFRIPAGDILIAAQWLAEQLGRAWSFSADRLRQHASDRQSDWRRSVAGLRVFDRDWPIEIWLRRWDICGIIFLSMLVVIFVMLALA